MKKLLLLCVLALQAITLLAEDGYRLWLRYDRISSESLRQTYLSTIQSIYFPGSSPTISVAKAELKNALRGLLQKDIPETKLATAKSLQIIKTSESKYKQADSLGKEGFAIYAEKGSIIITANSDIGCLYGVFHFLRLLQTEQTLANLRIVSVPKIQNRILNHWDNLNRTVERGYAGMSIWNWHTLPAYIDQRYIDYARANASIGINGTVITNVNANALSLTKPYLDKARALADAFRPYGLKIYLTAKFSAPIEIGGLKTADPLNDSVRLWWKQKADEIYALIPDFGGFLVKANSEGQPGPQNYGRTHAEGANMLADAVSAHNGIVIWRAFVYDVRVQKAEENFEDNKERAAIASADRFKQAYAEFKPLDSKFRKNVLLQVKNGPIDFQPREPFSPLFGATPATPLVMEFQLTQEYLGQGTHLVYQAPLYEEVMQANTNGSNTPVALVVDGSVDKHNISAISAVANIGAERNWTNHPFSQSNWYAYGRLAWNHGLTPATIANEWTRQTFTNEAQSVKKIVNMMLTSREAAVNYMTPLGLHHIMATSHHYGPGPWVNNLGRADWNPVYYHRADAFGLGFDRTKKGSDALSQYSPEAQKIWADSNTCDEKFLLWFHHVSWQHKMKSGLTFWNELCTKYQLGVDSVKWMKTQWQSLSTSIDDERFKQVNMLLDIQLSDAEWWRDACILYFQTFSKLPVPSNIPKAKYTLDYYKSLKFPYAPGIGGNL